jgi:thiol-disulfide isomerase/thioredoxin
MKIATRSGVSLCAIFALILPSTELANVGGSLFAGDAIALAAMKLDPQLQGKPTIVYIYATWCPGCKNIAPTMAKLQSQYRDRVNFVVLDVSDRKAIQASMMTARKFGLMQFFSAHRNQTSTVAIIDPATGRTLKKFQNNANLEDYQGILDPALARIKP